MAQSLAEKLAYMKGYNTGRRNGWPAHRPPCPPEEVIADLMRALTDLRDCTDSLCATLDCEDDFVIQLSPLIDAATLSLEAVTAWLTTQGDTDG